MLVATLNRLRECSCVYVCVCLFLNYEVCISDLYVVEWTDGIINKTVGASCSLYSYRYR